MPIHGFFSFSLFLLICNLLNGHTIVRVLLHTVIYGHSSSWKLTFLHRRRKINRKLKIPYTQVPVVHGTHWKNDVTRYTVFQIPISAATTIYIPHGIFQCFFVSISVSSLLPCLHRQSIHPALIDSINSISHIQNHTQIQKIYHEDIKGYLIHCCHVHGTHCNCEWMRR
jgi:hypothetical protein